MWLGKASAVSSLLKTLSWKRTVPLKIFLGLPNVAVSNQDQQRHKRPLRSRGFLRGRHEQVVPLADRALEADTVDALMLRRFAGGETMWLTKGDKTDVIIVVVTALVLFARSC
jgi:hypothetical protein